MRENEKHFRKNGKEEQRGCIDLCYNSFETGQASNDCSIFLEDISISVYENKQDILAKLDESGWAYSEFEPDNPEENKYDTCYNIDGGCPDMSVFSETNLKTMRLWYRFYADAVNGQQAVDELSPDDIFRLITAIPWGHNQRIIFKCKDLREAIFYVQYTSENNWSRDVLVHQIWQYKP